MNAIREQGTPLTTEESATNKAGSNRSHFTKDGLSGSLLRVEVFVDCANINRAIEDLGMREVRYGRLISWATKKFKTRAREALTKTPLSRTMANLATSTTSPTFYRGTMWWFAAKPVNFHPDDRDLVAILENCNDALKDDGFIVQPVPVDHHGFHIRKELRKVSSDEWERNWNKQDAGVDIALATRLLRRCLAEDRPDAVLLVSGDCDFVPVLQEIMMTCPQVTVGVAAFRDRLAGVYWPNNKLGIQWHVRPIVMDHFFGGLVAGPGLKQRAAVSA